MAGQSASFDDTSFKKNHEHGGEKLSHEIAVMIESLRPLPDQSKCCIYKVSDHIRKSNELEAYTPQVISIGPFHRKNPKLQKMESFKLRYLESFRDRAKVEKVELEDIVRTIKGVEESVRECYSDRETLPPDSDDFVKMILVDASFIIEYFRKNKSKVNWTEYDKEILKPWLCNRMQMDLILLENQLPFFIIDKIYNTAFPSRSKKHPFIELCFCQFQYYNVQNSPHSGSEEILHFTDLLRNFCMPPWRRPNGSSEVTIDRVCGKVSEATHQPSYVIPEDSGSFAEVIEPCDEVVEPCDVEASVDGSITIKEMHSATQLAEVGLKFKMIKSSIRSQLELKYENGVLEIPRFQLDDTTEIYARNLIALEECRYRKNAYITNYYTLLSFLIKTGKDLDVLVEEQIIDNWLDGAVATSMINKLSGGFYIQMNSDYHKMAEELNKFYNNPPKLMPLIRVLFRTRLRRIVTISGSVELFLSAAQAVCSVLSLKDF